MADQPKLAFDADESYWETLPRILCAADNAAQATGVMIGTSIWLPAGVTVSRIAFCSGGTAAGTPTHWGFALYNPAGNLVCYTADQTTGAWAANTVKELAIAKDSAGGTITSFTTLVAGWYIVAQWATATTLPTLRGASTGHAVIAQGVIAGQVAMSQSSGSGLTTAPAATWASPTNLATPSYATVRP